MSLAPPDLSDEPPAVRDHVRAVVLARPGAAREGALAAVPTGIRKRVLELVVADLALACVKHPAREGRRRLLAGAPEALRARVEAEARRLWGCRAGK